MPGGLPPFRVLVGSRDFTTEAQNLTFSNVDPGGYEICTFDMESERADSVMPGDRTRILDGLGVVWEGRISEPDKTIHRGWQRRHRVNAATLRVNAEGYGASLKDNSMSMVFVDQDLSRWGVWSITRQIALINTSFNIQQFSEQVAAAKDGLPAIKISGQGQLVGAAIYELYYDAGPLNTVGEIICTAVPITYANPDASDSLQFYASSDNSASNVTDTTQYGKAGTVNIDWLPANLQRFAAIQHWYQQAATAFFGDANKNYGWYLQQLAVYGPHGLTKRGGTPSGFYTSDIALFAARQAQLAGAPFKVGQVDTMNLYIVPHYVQYTPTSHDQIVSDMARLAPAHYGVWESSSIFDELPEFVFRGYSNVPNRFISLAECDEVDVSERLADMYTQAEISYQDAAGTSYVITVQLPNYILNRVGIKRTYYADIGLSSKAAASTFASFALQALFAQARSGGSLTLPTSIRDSQGARTPAYRLKAGIDRIRVADLSSRQGSFLSYDTDGYRISRVESNVDTTSGQVSTRAEIDTGPQLLDTLNARMQIASNLGASF